jgi:V/A-type H+-transporting ATPase subunit D
MKKWLKVLSTELTGIHPTRLELVRLRRRKVLADGIIDILNKDLEALMMTLFESLKEIRLLQGRVAEALDKAYGLFIEAEMIQGTRKIEEVSLPAQSVDFDIDIDTRSGVLGIVLPTFKLSIKEVTNPTPRFSLLDTSAKIDEACLRTWDALSNITQLAEAEASIREFLEVISIKRRQVNRLQYKVLPELDNQIRYVETILEETERQDAIRVRVLQRKRKERAMRVT